MCHKTKLLNSSLAALEFKLKSQIRMSKISYQLSLVCPPKLINMEEYELNWQLGSS